MKRRGFTIVELLIVVVVIAILAAITIVAFNDIQDRARQSAAQAAAKQAHTKIIAFAVENADSFPATLSAIGLADGNGTTYQYRHDNSVSPRTFCATVTTNNVSYFVSNTNASPSIGSCAGHGLNGIAAITNLASDPRATGFSNLPAGVGQIVWRTSRWYGGGGSATGSYSLVSNAVDGPAGISSYIRKTWTTAPPALSNSGDTGFDNGFDGTNGFSVTAGEVYTASCYVRGSVTRNYLIGVYQFASNGSQFSTPRVYGPGITGQANAWTRVSWQYTVPSGVSFVRFTCDSNSSANGAAENWANQSTLDGTGFMLTRGDQLWPYGDGTSSGWLWNGAPNASSSTGPVL